MKPPVHPRGGGDKDAAGLNPNRVLGSSPRGRGQEVESNSSAGKTRFIPAGAGTSPSRPPRRRTGTVHPRGGGDKSCGGPVRRRGGGSSPRGRGQDGRALVLGSLDRFIPAGAGTRRSPASGCRRETVHPRGGGDKKLASTRIPFDFGSSPRGRGQGHELPQVAPVQRFIPAGAGTRPVPRQTSSRNSVHPRGGGDKSLFKQGRLEVSGSSPRGRGQVFSRHTPRPLPRFIPAGAGTSFPASSPRALKSVHPRGGGDKPNAATARGYSGGSSPRGRGQGTRFRRQPRRHRFIPAGAGTRSGPPAESSPTPVHPRGGGDKVGPFRSAGEDAVHPRGGGDKFEAGDNATSKDGSSPRGRGQDDNRKQDETSSRFIPAGAGTSAKQVLIRDNNAVHPRGGGDKRTGRATTPTLTGSSPRGRGQGARLG